MDGRTLRIGVTLVKSALDRSDAIRLAAFTLGPGALGAILGAVRAYQTARFGERDKALAEGALYGALAGAAGGGTGAVLGRWAGKGLAGDLSRLTGGPGAVGRAAPDVLAALAALKGTDLGADLGAAYAAF